MKTYPFRTVIALLLLAGWTAQTDGTAQAGEPTKSADDRTIRERIAQSADAVRDKLSALADRGVEQARKAWKQTQSFLSDSPDAHRQGAVERLADLDREIAKLEVASKHEWMRDREYFRTRLAALTQHYDYTLRQLERLPNDKTAEGYELTRKAFDNTLEDLENALDQARQETRSEP